MKAPLAFLIAAFCSLSACRQDSPVVFDLDGIQVSVTEVRNPAKDYSTFQTQVRFKGQELCWSNGPFGISNREVRATLSRVVYQDRYLFVPSSCGGGNASKCQGYQAFATQGELRWLGNLTGRWDGRNVIAYEQGRFYDTGDMLEINDLLAHYESPRYALAYSQAGGQLRFEPAQTWALNAERFKEAPNNTAAGLLYRAGLAKLCGKSAELRAAQAQADKLLNEKGRKLFRSSLAKVKTSDIQPSAFMSPGPCHAAPKEGD